MTSEQLVVHIQNGGFFAIPFTGIDGNKIVSFTTRPEDVLSAVTQIVAEVPDLFSRLQLIDAFLGATESEFGFNSAIVFHGFVWPYSEPLSKR